MRYVFALLVGLLMSLQGAYAYQPTDTALLLPKPFADWKTLETEHFRINFLPSELAYAQRVAAVAERVYGRLTERLKWQPVDPIQVVISDSFDGSNGGASVLPYNRFFIFMNTPVEGELLDNSPWIEQVFTHELVHILHLDQAAGGPSRLRNIFGRFFLAFPQIFNPTWVSEGIAVYEETNADTGFGRGQSALYAAAMRAEVANGLRSFTEMGFYGAGGTDWPDGQSYLYGYYFFEFLVNEYSEAKAYQYLSDWNTNIIPWQMNARTQHVFGMDAETLWQKFQGYLIAKFATLPQGPELSQAVVTAGRINSNPVWLGNGDFYYFKNNGRVKPSIQKIDAEGKETTVAKVQSFKQFDVHPEAGVLMSRGVICDNVDVYTDLYRLKEKDKWQRLTHCQRYPRAAWSTSGEKIAAVHVSSGRSRIDLLDAAGQRLDSFDFLPAGEAIGQLSWSPQDDRIVAAVRREATGWNIEVLDIASGRWTPLVTDGELNQSPQFSADGQALYFISTVNDLANVQRLDMASGRIQTVSRTTTALLDFAVKGDQLRVVEYTAHGINIQQQTIASWGAVRSSSQPAKKLASWVNQPEYSTEAFTQVTDYSSWNTLGPKSWFAFFYADSEDNSWLQFYLQGQDVLGYHFWQIAPSYYFDKKEVGGSLAYIAYHRLALLLDRTYESINVSGSDFKVWDQETRYQAVWMQPFNSFDGTFQVNFGVAFEDIERVVEDFGRLDDQEDNLGGLSFSWRDYDQYLHSISAENGRSINLKLENYDLFGDGFFQGELKSLDWREYISLPANHVLALRFVAGKSQFTSKPFELGNELDSMQSLGGQIGFGFTDFALRGYSSGEPELIGHNLRLYSAEYRMPIGEMFDGLTVPPVGLGKLAVHFLLDYGAAWDKGDDKKYYTGVGFEVHPEVLIGYSTFKLDSAIGVARGLDSDIGKTTIYFRLSSLF